MLKLNLLTVIFLFTIFSLNSFSREDYSGSIIKTDGTGNSYVAGSFKSKTITFGNFTLKNIGSDDLFLVRYNSEGRVVWAKSIGGRGSEEVKSLDVDNDGSISLTASSNSKEIYFENSGLENKNHYIIFSAEFSSSGILNSSLITEQIIPAGNKSFKSAGNDTSITIISPAQNDNWKVGTKAILKWDYENVEFVLIELSTDKGASWQYVTATVADFDEYPILVPNTPSDSCLIKISDYYNPAIADTSGLFSISGKLYWTVKQNNYNSILTSAASPNSNTCFVAGFNGISKTTDNGNTWVHSLDGYGLFNIFFLNENIGWTVGFNGNIFKTTNGGSNWVKLNNSFNFHLLKVYFYDEDNGYMISDQYFLKTTDGGGSWTLTQPTSHILRAMFFFNKDTGWIAGGEGVILKTTNAGLTWVYQQMNGTDYGTLTSLLFTDDDKGFSTGSGLIVDGGVVLKTSDSGSQWSLAHNGYNRFIYSISFSSSDSGWAVGDEGIMFSTGDGGLNWELQGSGTLSDLHDISLKPDKTGWAVGDDGLILKFVYDSVSNPVPVELLSFNAVFINNRVNLNWTTATEINNKGFEIQRLQNYPNGSLQDRITGLQDWETIGFLEGKGTTPEVQDYQFTDIWLPAGEYSYRLKQIDFDGSFKFSNTVEVIVGLPNEFTLEQNYPNPFNPSTTIKYSLKENAYVTLKIYDILGSEVQTLIDEVMPSGNYSVNFNAGDLSSGTYFYIIQAGNFIQSRKMLLVK